jgi:hypothetical protein
MRNVLTNNKVIILNGNQSQENANNVEPNLRIKGRIYNFISMFCTI